MRPTVVMLAGLGLLYLLYTGRAEAVLSALSSGGSGEKATGSKSNSSNQSADTTAPVKGYKGKPNSQKCPSGYKWDSSRQTCVKHG